MQYINNRNEDYEKINFNLKIHSKDRNLQLQKNPFNFRINFDPVGSYDSKFGSANYPNYSIASKFENVKSIKLTDMVIPSKIYTNKHGVHVKHVNLIKISSKTARIFIDNNLVDYIIENDNGNIIMNFEYDSKTAYLSNQWNNNVIMIENKPYYIQDINFIDEIITFTTDLPNFEKTELYIPTFNQANCVDININTKKIEDNYISKIIGKNDILYNEENAIVVNSIENDDINFTFLYKTNNDPLQVFYLMERNFININEERCFYIKFKEFRQTLDTSSDLNINESIGTFYVDKVSSESSILVGNGVLTFNNRNLKNLTSLSFSLLDSNGNQLGDIYNDFTQHKIKENFNNVIFNLEITVLKEKFN